MGQKIHPTGLRIGPLYTWKSRWFAGNKQYKDLLYSDVLLRRALKDRLKSAGLAQIDIERSINKMKIIIHVSRPGVVIGRGGSGLEEVKKFIQYLVKKYDPTDQTGKNEHGKTKIEVIVEPVKDPNLNANIVATNIADQIARRMPHKRVTLQAVDRVMSAGAKGVKVVLAGRIGGAEIHRKEKYGAGSVPLSTIREDIDYAEVPSLTKSGYVGVKVWICKKGSL